MNKYYNYKTVIGIVISGIILTVIILCLNLYTPVNNEYTIIISSMVVIIVASVLGPIAGILTPFIGYAVCTTLLPGTVAVEGFIMLLFAGFSGGHYAEKFGVCKGTFFKRARFDFCIVEICVAAMSWVFVYPIVNVFLFKTPIDRCVMIGFGYFIVAVASILVVCLPIMIILNMFYVRSLETERNLTGV